MKVPTLTFVALLLPLVAATRTEPWKCNDKSPECWCYCDEKYDGSGKKKCQRNKVDWKDGAEWYPFKDWYECDEGGGTKECERVSTGYIRDCEDFGSEDKCKDCCAYACERENKCSKDRCQGSKDCDNFDRCYNDCKDRADCYDKEECVWCSDDSRWEIVCWKGESYQVCRDAHKSDCNDYGNERYDWKPDKPWKNVEKYNKEKKYDYLCEDDEDEGSSCTTKVDRCCNCCDKKCHAGSVTDSSERSCIKDRCKKQYCQSAGDCKYGTKKKWKKVIEDQCDVKWK